MQKLHIQPIYLLNWIHVSQFCFAISFSNSIFITNFLQCYFFKWGRQLPRSVALVYLLPLRITKQRTSFGGRGRAGTSRRVEIVYLQSACCMLEYIDELREHSMSYLQKNVCFVFGSACAMYIKWAHPAGVFNSKRVCECVGVPGGCRNGRVKQQRSWLLLIIGAVAKFDTCSNGGKNFDGASRIYWRRASHFWAQFMSLSLHFVDWNFQKIQFQLTHDGFWWDQMRGWFDRLKLDFDRFQSNDVEIKRFESLLLNFLAECQTQKCQLQCMRDKKQWKQLQSKR